MWLMDIEGTPWAASELQIMEYILPQHLFMSAAFYSLHSLFKLTSWSPLMAILVTSINPTYSAVQIVLQSPLLLTGRVCNYTLLSPTETLLGWFIPITKIVNVIPNLLKWTHYSNPIHKPLCRAAPTSCIDVMLWYVCENSSTDPRTNQFHTADCKKFLSGFCPHFHLWFWYCNT